MKIGYFVDWLEVYCHERKDIDMVERLRSLGYKVMILPYTTRVYGQVLEVSSSDGTPLFTVCRGPLSVKDMGRSGVLPGNACHIKIHNMWCYQENVGSFFMNVAKACGVKIKSISRIDICADFQYFRCGMAPGTLLRGFLTEKYLKINQPRFSVYGSSNKGYNEYNGASFGSKNSCVFTRFYCKSLEMQEVKQKNWILDCWNRLGFDLTKQVWRVEFMITGPGRKNLDRNTAEVSEIEISDLCSHTKIRALFLLYAHKYFVFTDSSSASRKYEQKRLDLFDTDPMVGVYQPFPKVSTNSTTRSVKQVCNFLKKESLKQGEYSEQQRWDMFSMAEKIGIHFKLRQWLKWQDVTSRVDLPIGEPVKNPITQVLESVKGASDNNIVEQREIW